METRPVQNGRIFKCKDEARGCTFYVGSSVVKQLEKSLDLANIRGTEQTPAERALTIIGNVMATGAKTQVRAGIFDTKYTWENPAGQMTFWTGQVTPEYGAGLQPGMTYVGSVQITRAQR